VLILGSFLLQMDLQRLPSYRVHSPFHVPELISRRLIRVDVPLNHSWDFKHHLQADRVLKSWIFDGTSGAVHSESWVCMGASFQRSARSNTGFLEFYSSCLGLDYIGESSPANPLQLDNNQPGKTGAKSAKYSARYSAKFSVLAELPKG
jgi:hypothetical protein